MKKVLVILAILSVSSASFAQKIKVRKVKGKQAVIEFTGGALEAGRVYELAPDEFNDSSVTTSSRKYMVDLDLLVQSSKSDASTASNEMDIGASGRFGWNYGSYEFGPIGSYLSDSSGSTTTVTVKLGGFYDFNLISNTPGEAFIYGLGAYGAFGQSDDGANTTTLMDFFGGAFAKWFPTGSNVGFRFDGGYIYQKQNANSADVTITGFKAAVGLLAYF